MAILAQEPGARGGRPHRAMPRTRKRPAEHGGVTPSAQKKFAESPADYEGVVKSEIGRKGNDPKAELASPSLFSARFGRCWPAAKKK